MAVAAIAARKANARRIRPIYKRQNNINTQVFLAVLLQLDSN
jgi:hypothetical protein